MQKLLRLSGIFFLVIAVTGCYQGRPSEKTPIHVNPNMDDQPKYQAQEKSEFFKDKSTMRMPVPGTVARNELRADERYYTGKEADGRFVRVSPVPYAMDVLERGQERYDIYCAPCHDRTGAGQGIIVKKGFLPPPSFHIDRLRDVEDGYIFDLIGNGIRNMPSYRHQINVPDRWAIVAYYRALQRSQNAAGGDVPADIRANLK